MADLCYSIPEAANALGISESLARKLARRGDLPTVQFGARRLVPKAALATYLDDGPQDAA